jgi:hypothetical protein
MENKIEALVKKYNYFGIDNGCLYWDTGETSERILVAHISSIDIQADKAVLKSNIGTWFGYHEVVFTAKGAEFTENLSNVVYFDKNGKVKK